MRAGEPAKSAWPDPNSRGFARAITLAGRWLTHRYRQKKRAAEAALPYRRKSQLVSVSTFMTWMIESAVLSPLISISIFTSEPVSTTRT